MLNLFPKAVSTHLSDGSIAVFTNNGMPNLVKFYPKPAPQKKNVSQKLIHSSHVVHQRWPDACIHRDVRLPFGEALTENSVEQSLFEVLGGRRDEFLPSRWHEMFSEDTRQGTEHRIFVTLYKAGGASSQEPADAYIPLQVGLMALCNHIAENFQRQQFQLVVLYQNTVFSLLVFGNLVYHSLQFKKSADLSADIARLAKQRDYGLASTGVDEQLPLFILAPNPSAWQEAAMADKHWSPQALPAILDSEKTDNPYQKVQIYCHLGMKLAFTDMDLNAHNSVNRSVTRQLGFGRDKRFAIVSIIFSILLCLAAGGFMGFKYQRLHSQLMQINRKAESHQEVLKRILGLREQKSALADSLHQLRPLWYLPIAWDGVLSDIQNAMPRQSGIEALVVKISKSGETQIQFKAWVKNWDHITGIQKRLSTSPYFANVKDSDQRKNKKRHYISFNMISDIKKF